MGSPVPPSALATSLVPTTSTSHIAHRMASLHTYTQNIPLTQKAKFWTNYVSALKGTQDLRASDPTPHPWHPSVLAHLPDQYPDLKQQFSRLESELDAVPKRRSQVPLTRVIPEANDRIHSLGYSYYPVHTEIYGTYRAHQAK